MVYLSSNVGRFPTTLGVMGEEKSYKRDTQSFYTGIVTSLRKHHTEYCFSERQIATIQSKLLESEELVHTEEDGIYKLSLKRES